jgi:hypothetical protein
MVDPYEKIASLERKISRLRKVTIAMAERADDAAKEYAATLATMQAREAELAEHLIDQRDEPFDETDRLHYWRDKAINAARTLQGPSDAG